ncbi:MAG: TlpA disulfide reductase family protein [Acidimicrobiia bacterium]
MNARASKPSEFGLLARTSRRHWGGVLAVLVSLLMVLASSCSSDNQAVKPNGSGAAAGNANGDSVSVAYNAVDAVTGEAVSIDDLVGRPAMVSSWATWCAPCRRELPALERLHLEQPKDGLQVVIVNLDSSTRDETIIQKMVDDLDLTMTQWRDGDDNFTQIFKGFGVPMSVLIDSSGQIVHTWHGAINPDSEGVRSIIEKVL